MAGIRRPAAEGLSNGGRRRKPGKASEPFLIGGKSGRASHIYHAAAEIMLQKGYEATSMNDIADAAGLTKAGIYHYIRSKEALLFEILGYAMDVVEEGVMKPAREVADAEERLRTIVEHHTTRLLEGTGAITILLDEMQGLTPAHRKVIRARKRAYFEFIRDTLTQLASEGRLRDISPTSGAFGVLGMILWLSRWYRRGDRLTPTDVVRDYREMAMNAVLKRD